MRAAVIADGDVAVQERPDPEPGAGEVLVRVRAAGLNGADMLQRKGGYPAPPGSPPDIPGLELAGEVAALGAGAARFGEGDRVMAIVGGGAQGASVEVTKLSHLLQAPVMAFRRGRGVLDARSPFGVTLPLGRAGQDALRGRQDLTEIHVAAGVHRAVPAVPRGLGREDLRRAARLRRGRRTPRRRALLVDGRTKQPTIC